MRRVALLIVMTLFVSGLILFEGANDAAAVDGGAVLEISDKNGDGRIDREEYHRRMADVFFFTDADKDNQLTRGELSNTPQNVFNAADDNRDGKLSMTEYINARFKDFETADRDRDGVLSRGEIQSP